MSTAHKVWTRILFGFVLAAFAFVLCPSASAQLACDNPNHGAVCVQRFVDEVPYPPFMQATQKVGTDTHNFDAYEIAARQIEVPVASCSSIPLSQRCIAAGVTVPLPQTIVWGYGQNGFPYDYNAPTNVCAGDGSDTAPCFFSPAPSIFVVGRGGQANTLTHVNWINDLVCHSGDKNSDLTDCAGTVGIGKAFTYTPGVKPSFDNHRANPTGICNGPATTPSDCKGLAGYTGPVPLITHVHGAISPSFSDGIPEAWYLPTHTSFDAVKYHFQSGDDYCSQDNVAPNFAFANVGAPNPPLLTQFAYGVPSPCSTGNSAYQKDGAARFVYPNRQFGTTLFFHDHSLGVTTENVYMGLAGFYLIQGSHTDPATWCDNGPSAVPDCTKNPFNFADDLPSDCAPAATCIGGAASVTGGLPQGDCSFGVGAGIQSGNCFFWPLAIADRAICATNVQCGPTTALKFSENGGLIVVNGKTWPILDVQPRKYRFKIVIAAPTSRFDFTFPTPNNNENGAPPVATITQIGADGGNLPNPVKLTKPLSLMPGERADIIVDFSQFWWCAPPLGNGNCTVDLLNANGSGDTGTVMRFAISQSLPGCDPANNFAACFPPTADTSCNIPGVLTCTASDTLPHRASEAPTGVRQVSLFDDHLGNCPVAGCVGSKPLPWDAKVTETPTSGSTETWEMYDFMDSHPMHLHEAQFQVVNRENMTTHVITGPGPGETGFKDTVQANGGQITRVRATFQGPRGPKSDSQPEVQFGPFAWHCHINPHEDNEMMRPMCVQLGNGSPVDANCANRP